MNFRDVEYFLKVCEQGSFNMAAKQLFISPQGLGSVITKMEQELGCDLIYRTRTGIFLTPYGRALKPYAEKLTLFYRKALNEIETIRNVDTGVIRLGCSFGALNSLDEDFPVLFQERHPEYRLSYAELTDAAIEEMIDSGKLDIGLTGNPDTANLHCVPISTSSILFVTHSKSRFYGRASVSVEEIAAEPLTLRSAGFATTRLLLREFESRGIEPNILFSTADLIRSLRYCRRQEANTIILKHLANDYAYGDLHMIPFEEDLKWNLCMITAKDREPTQAVKDCMACLRKHI